MLVVFAGGEAASLGPQFGRPLVQARLVGEGIRNNTVDKLRKIERFLLT